MLIGEKIVQPSTQADNVSSCDTNGEATKTMLSFPALYPSCFGCGQAGKR